MVWIDSVLKYGTKIFQVYNFISTRQCERRNNILKNPVLNNFNGPNSIEHELGAGHVVYNLACRCYYVYVEVVDEEVESKWN